MYRIAVVKGGRWFYYVDPEFPGRAARMGYHVEFIPDGL